MLISLKWHRLKKHVQRCRIGYGDLTNAEGAFKETLLGYINATNDNESAFDGESFDGNDFVDFIVLIITKFDHSRSCTF
jgi:hypothetical protein